MKFKTTRRVRPLAVLMVMLMVSGCSTLPTAPQLDVNGQSATSASDPSILGLGGGPGVLDPLLNPVLQPLLPLIPPITPVVDSLIRTLPIEGITGGVLRNGNITILIPPGAILGDAVVQIEVHADNALHCSLEITPPEKNGFHVPVILRIDARGVPNLERMGIAWFNPDTRIWEPVESYVDVQNGTIEAPLDHFSEYRVQEVFKSKAGW